VPADDTKTEELAAVIREIQQRVRARHPQGALGPTEIPFPDLMPLVHARDSAGAKVASIGTVNPRRGGVLNSVLQGSKKLVSRALDWHVREQVEFNRASMACIEAILEAFEESNRALALLTGRIHDQALEAHAGARAAREELAREVAVVDARLAEMDRRLGAMSQRMAGAEAEARELKDIRKYWADWRGAWEDRQNRSEIHLLRSVSELNASFQHRLTLAEASFRQTVNEQHAAFDGALAKSILDVQDRLWGDLRRMRADYDRLIHDELRMIRQRGALQPPPAAAPSAAAPAPPPAIDWLAFANRFRGSEEHVRRSQTFYLDRFAGIDGILDLGCGRGEFLEAASEAGIAARGIDASEEAVALCRAKGLNAEVADIFEYLAALPDETLGGVYCSQVIEHLPPARLPELVRLIAAKLLRAGVAAFETPNPECLAIFATHFYLDPTHIRPIPPPLLVFALEESGFGQIEVEPLHAAIETMPALDGLPADFRNAFFGGLDYAVFARKL
jgi:2-polyprenyl-3-methyl-5-hydroxy-6-metoxy-1,4-benzoquinol methylase